jgi:ribosomal protein S18 acetylase RimI-like enzyme
MTEELVPAVRRALGSDARDLAVVLARAFEDDPVWSWMLPDETTRRGRLGIVFDTLVRHVHLRNGGAELAALDGPTGSVALWDPPGQWRLSFDVLLRQMPAFLRGFGTRLPAAFAALTTVERHHPGEPHWYLSYLGTDPVVQGRGLGGALMRSRLDRCDREGTTAYLESSKESNIPFYENFGFRVTREISMPRYCPPVWAMWRDPH